MYNKQEASRLRRSFWTSFGQYMHPVEGAAEKRLNWLNYKTGIRHIHFRMDADHQQAAIAIEITHPDALQREHYYQLFLDMKTVFREMVGTDWEWQPMVVDGYGKQMCRIGSVLKGVNIFTENDWPAIISFLKPRMLALDRFWFQVKEFF